MKNLISSDSVYSTGNLSKWLVPTLYYVHNYNSFDMVFHRHSQMEIMYLASGEMHLEYYNAEGEIEECTIMPNNYVFVDSNVLHKIYVDNEPSKIYNLEFLLDSDTVFNFSLNTLRLKCPAVGEFLQSQQPVACIYDTGNFFQNLTMIQKYLGDNNNLNTAQDVYVNYLLGALFTLMCIQYSENKVKFGVGIKYVNIALQYITRNFNQNIALPDIAAACNLSPNYLNNLFSQSLNITVKNYINQYRIKRAMQLLANTDASIDDISKQVGYNSKVNFHQNFQKFTGMSPMKYRQQVHDFNFTQSVNNYSYNIYYR